MRDRSHCAHHSVVAMTTWWLPWLLGGCCGYSVVAMATQWLLLVSPTAVSGVLNINITDSSQKPILATRGFLVSWYMQ